VQVHGDALVLAKGKIYTYKILHLRLPAASRSKQKAKRQKTRGRASSSQVVPEADILANFHLQFVRPIFRLLKDRPDYEDFGDLALLQVLDGEGTLTSTTLVLTRAQVR
jgi:hypothetical protein